MLMILLIVVGQFVCTTLVFGIDVSRFGDFEGQKNIKVTLNDINGVPVTFALSGGGHGEVSDDTAFSQITLDTTEKSAFSITTKGKGITTSVGDITVNGPIKSITAKTTDLAGNITIDGSLGSLMLNNVSGDRIITIGSSSNPKAGVLMKFNRVSDLSIDSDMPIRTLSAVEWLDTDATIDHINVPSLGTVSITGNKKLGLIGDFAPEINVTGAGMDPAKPILRNAKIAGIFGAIGNTSTVNGSVSSISTAQLQGDLYVNGNAKSIKSNQPMAICSPEGGYIGMLNVAGSASVKSGKDKIKFYNDALYSSEPNLYRLEDLRLYDVLGARWDYTGTYKISGIIRESGSATGTVEVDDHLANMNGHECSTITVSSEGVNLSTSWYDDSDGTHLAVWSNNSDAGQLEISLNSPLVAPKFLRLRQQYNNSGTFDGQWDIDTIYGSITGDITGTAKTSCKLVGHEQVTVNAGTFVAAKVVVGLTMTGTMGINFEGEYFSGKFSASETQTWWGVPEVGVVKVITKVTVKVRIAGAGSASLTVAETDELSSYSVPSYSPLFTVPGTKYISGHLQIPAGSPLVPEALTIGTIAGRASLDSSGNFSGLNVVNVGSGQIAYIENASDTLITVVYIPPEQIENGQLSLGSTQMALALIKMNPYVAILSPENQKQVLAAAENHSDFASLVSSIENALINAPELMSDYDSYPYIYNTAALIAVETMQSFSSSSASLQGAYATFMGNSSGEESSLLSSMEVSAHEGGLDIVDAPGSLVTIVNPKFTFYGVQANDEIDLIRGKQSLVTLWPPWEMAVTPSVTKDWNLGDGTFHVTFYKGFNLDVDGWYNPMVAPGKATLANTAKCLVIGLEAYDLINPELSGVTHAFLKGFSLSNAEIESAILLFTAKNPNIDFSTLANAMGHRGWKYVFCTVLPDWIRNNWDEIRLWLWEGTADWVSDSDTISKFLSNCNPIAANLAKGLIVVNIGNEWAPFFVDLCFAPKIVSFDIRQQNGVLTEVTSLIPPSAAYSISNYNPAVGESVSFDASGSTDDTDSPATLQVRWDFDGDDIWDTDWTTNKTATHVYNQRGFFRPVVEVKDSDNLTSEFSQDIVVGSSDSFKIVLTWGENPRDLDSHLFTPSIGGSTYHVYYVSKGSATNNPYVWLDLDDQYSYGPETIWFERFYPGTYTYSVYLYAGSGDLPTSSAHVEVINAMGVIASFDVPHSGTGRWWNVFTLDGSTKSITPVNSISDSSSSTSALTFMRYYEEEMPPKE